MKISREARIGVLVTISLIIFFVGFYFLKGIDLFSDDRTYYSYYDAVDGLIPSAPIEIRGLNVGHVAELHLEGRSRVKVTLSVHKSIILPTGTVATITSDGFLGNKMIRLDLGAGPGVVEKGSTLTTAEEPGVVDNISDQMTPLIKSLRKTVNSLDTVIAGVNILAGAENRAAITASLRNINLSTENVAALTTSLSKEAGEINEIVHNANSFTGTLAKNNDTVRRILSNLNNVTSQLAASPIQKTMAELQDMSDQMKSVMTKINNGQGSLGELVNDKGLYNNLNKAVASMDNLMKDINAHPSKYINVTVFGKKKSKD